MTRGTVPAFIGLRDRRPVRGARSTRCCVSGSRPRCCPAAPWSGRSRSRARRFAGWRPSTWSMRRCSSAARATWRARSTGSRPRPSAGPVPARRRSERRRQVIAGARRACPAAHRPGVAARGRCLARCTDAAGAEADRGARRSAVAAGIPPPRTARRAALPELPRRPKSRPRWPRSARATKQRLRSCAALDRIGLETEARRPRASLRADLLLVVDQLDDLFGADVSAADRAAFARLLRALVASERVWVVATLRAALYELFLGEGDLEALKACGRRLRPRPAGPRGARRDRPQAGGSGRPRL